MTPKLHVIAALAALATLATVPAPAADVVIYGGTPGGIAVAISAARMGSEVTLVEYHDHIGGMTTSGLGKSDIEHKVSPRNIPVEELQEILASQGQVLRHSSHEAQPE